MKILIVFNHPAPYKVNFFDELSKKIDLEVVFERRKCSNRDYRFYLKNDFKFKAHFLNNGAFGEENSNTGELVRFLKQNYTSYDFIIMNGYSTITEMRAINFLNKKKVKWLLFVNGGIIHDDGFIKRFIKRRIVSSAYRYFSPSEETDKYLIHYGARKNDILRYPNSTIFEKEVLDAPLTREQKDEIRKEFNLPSGMLFVSPTQFIKRKNNIQLISIFKDRKEHLLLIGSGEEKHLYEQYIIKNNVNNVHIVDFVNKKILFKIMRSCDCFITLSKEDIYGHTTNESLSQGLPVISSNMVVSSLNLVKDGKNGYIVPCDDEVKITHAMDSIKEDMGTYAISVAKENTIEKMTEIIYHELEELKK